MYLQNSVATRKIMKFATKLI